MRGLGLVLSLFLMTASTVSCSKQETVKSDPEIQNLLRETHVIEEALATGRLMSRNTALDRDTARAIVYDLRVTLMRLNARPDEEGAIRIAFRLAQDLSRLPYIRTDKDQMERYTSLVLGTVYASAERNKVEVNASSWRQFSYQFSSGLEPFRSFGTKGDWITDWSQDEFSYTKVEGFGNQAYLVSPEFDLRNVIHPTFKIRHLTIVDDNSKATDVAFNRDLILANAFKVRVFGEDYTGDPKTSRFEQIDDIGPIPVGMNFETLNSPEIDLSRWAGKKIRLAFYFDMNQSLLGSHYVTWQIYRFDLYAVGTVPAPVADSDGVLLEQGFLTGDLRPFKAFKGEGGEDGEQFVPASFRGRNYAKIFAHSTEASRAYLLSPYFPLGDAKDLTLTLKETVNAARWSDFKIWISDNYTGGGLSLATWNPLIRVNPPTPFPEWKDVISGPWDLSAYQGKTVTILFEYADPGNTKAGWEIETLIFKGLGENIVPSTERP